MNLQTHMSGQFSGQVSNQDGNSLLVVPQQNGDSLSTQMQNPGGHHNTGTMDPGFVKARRFIQGKIYECLMQRQQAHEIHPKKVLDIARRLEENLCKTATTKDEYMNLNTLASRLHAVIKGQPGSNQSQQYQHVNSSSSIGTMIPTPGMPQSGNSSLVPSTMDNSMISASGGNSMASTTVNTGNLVPNATGASGGMHNGSFNLSEDLRRMDINSHLPVIR